MPYSNLETGLYRSCLVRILFLFLPPLYDFFRLSSTAVQTYLADGEKKLLPALTVCPLTSYKAKGKYFYMENVLNNTFEKEEVFSPLTLKMLKNESEFSVKEVYSLMLGRCFTVTRFVI